MISKKERRKRKRKRKRKNKNRPILRGIGCVVLEPFFDIKERIKIKMNKLTPESVRDLKEGDFPVEETIKLPIVAGSKVTGVAGAQYIPPKKHYRGDATNLIWEGVDENGAILLITGVGAVVEKVTFVDGPIGIHLAVQKKGLGTGKVAVRDCYFDTCGVAFEAGHKVSDRNNDNVILDHVIADDCESLLRLRNAHAMGYSLRDCVVRGSRT